MQIYEFVSLFWSLTYILQPMSICIHHYEQPWNYGTLPLAPNSNLLCCFTYIPIILFPFHVSKYIIILRILYYQHLTPHCTPDTCVEHRTHIYTHTYIQKRWSRYLINLVSNNYNIISTELQRVFLPLQSQSDLDFMYAWSMYEGSIRSPKHSFFNVRK